MKKRILLSLVSLFTMTAMWANLTQVLNFSLKGDAGKTGQNATLTLSLKNTQSVINTWSCTVALPEGVTYVDGTFATVDGRYPSNYGTPTLSAVVNSDGSVTFSCAGEAGTGIDKGEGDVATFEVAIASTVEPKVYTVEINTMAFVTSEGAPITLANPTSSEWTIEEGSIQGDFNGNGKVDIGDAQMILIYIANGEDRPEADLNGNGKVDVGDAQMVLIMIANQ